MLNLLHDTLPIIFSAVALIVSLATLYFNHLRKHTKALFVLNSRLFGVSTSGTERELSYTISNLGNQEIFAKEINYFYGNSPLGPYKHGTPFLDYPSNCSEIPMIIKPGEIKSLVLKHKTNEAFFTHEIESEYKYRIVFVEAFSADGNRYCFVHDITELAPSHVNLDHSIWKSVKIQRIKSRKAKTTKQHEKNE